MDSYDSSLPANVFQFPVPMSGWAESGIGARSGGASGIRKYCKTKSIVAEHLMPKGALLVSLHALQRPGASAGGAGYCEPETGVGYSIDDRQSSRSKFARMRVGSFWEKGAAMATATMTSFEASATSAPAARTTAPASVIAKYHIQPGLDARHGINRPTLPTFG